MIFAENDYYSLDINDNINRENQNGTNRQFEWGAKSAGFGDRDGVGCCFELSGDWTNGRAQHGEWYMITYTLTAEEVDDEIYYRFRGYYNGQLLNDGITYNNWNRNVNDMSKLFIGASGPSMNHHFKGKVDDLRIYDGALSDEEINSLYNQNKLDDNNEDDLMYQVDIEQGDLTKTVYLYACLLYTSPSPRDS